MRVRERQAARFRVAGRVQGVGFRPFVARLARELGLHGWVRNDERGVLIHVEGGRPAIRRFSQRLNSDPPRGAIVVSIRRHRHSATGASSFSIRATPQPAANSALNVRVPVDVAICADCQSDIFDASNRRFAYAFTTCTDCGPRYSILHGLPYDRATTSMGGFPMCADCREEYTDADSRRFHAEPIACTKCGPSVRLLTAIGEGVAHDGEAISLAAQALRDGRILALKGIGGFQLLVRADCSSGVAELRRRKRRPSKPFAIMMATPEAARRLACLNDVESRLLVSRENPIILLQSKADCTTLAPEVAPGLSRIGVMLPTSPLHALLLANLDFPVVATSGNRQDEPIAIDDDEAFSMLGNIADLVLTHNRPIVQRVDDSVIQVIGGRPAPIRLARGYCPLPLTKLEEWTARRSIPTTAILATGAHQKVALAIWTGSQAVLGPYVGDMDGLKTRQAFERLAVNLPRLYGCQVDCIVHDSHPEYSTTRWAESTNKKTLAVQHHHAHAVAVMAEHGLLDEEVLAFTWDGTGLGADGTIWGGEAILARVDGGRRIASLLPFALPGGDRAIEEPARIGLVLSANAIGAQRVLMNRRLLSNLNLSPQSARTLITMSDRGIQAPMTTSLGRLFDGIAALALGVHRASYEGEGAARLESAANDDPGAYSMPLVPYFDGKLRADWRPMIRKILYDQSTGISAGTIAQRFHRAVIDWAMAIGMRFPHWPIVLGGGCFQNRLLADGIEGGLRHAGRRVYAPTLIPANDGGLAVGQLAIALAALTQVR